MPDKNRLHIKREALQKRIKEDARAKTIAYQLKSLIDDHRPYQLEFDNAHYHWMQKELPWSTQSLFSQTLDWDKLGTLGHLQLTHISQVGNQINEIIETHLSPEENIAIIYSNLHAPEIALKARDLSPHIHRLMDYPECWLINADRTFVMEWYDKEEMLRWQLIQK